MSKSDLIDLAVEIRHETANAFLVHDGHRDVWVPKSQCEVHYVNHALSDNPGGATITMPEWLAKAKELI
jgi:hypothetical protein